MRPFFSLATHLSHAQFARNVTAYIAYVSEKSLTDISRVIQRRASRHPPHTRCIPLTSAYNVHRPHLRASCISGTTTLSNKRARRKGFHATLRSTQRMKNSQNFTVMLLTFENGHHFYIFYICVFKYYCKNCENRIFSSHYSKYKNHVIY